VAGAALHQDIFDGHGFDARAKGSHTRESGLLMGFGPVRGPEAGTALEEIFQALLESGHDVPHGAIDAEVEPLLDRLGMRNEAGVCGTGGDKWVECRHCAQDLGVDVVGLFGGERGFVVACIDIGDVAGCSLRDGMIDAVVILPDGFKRETVGLSAREFVVEPVRKLAKTFRVAAHVLDKS